MMRIKTHPVAIGNKHYYKKKNIPAHLPPETTDIDITDDGDNITRIYINKNLELVVDSISKPL